jgi:hypothetical protein
MRKIVLAAALLATSPAFACIVNCNSDPSTWFGRPQDQMDNVLRMQENAARAFGALNNNQSRHCQSRPAWGGGWTTDCD